MNDRFILANRHVVRRDNVSKPKHLMRAATIGGLAAAALVSAAPVSAAQSIPAPQPSDAEIAKRANGLLAQMTLDEKIGQLVIPLDYSPASRKIVLSMIAAGKIGAVGEYYDPRSINQLQALNLKSSRLKIPLLFGVDVLHGWKTIFPINIGMAATWDPALVEKAQAVAAQEARASGVTWTFAPNADIARDPRFGRMVESSGEDPYLGAAMVVANVKGFQGDYLGAPGHIMSQLKHFAGYGAVLGGRDQEDVNIPDTDLWNVYLPPFEAGVNAGAGAVMSAYTALNGVPATGNKWLLKDVLRSTWHFKGMVSSDNNSVSDLKLHNFAADNTDAAARALSAGVDMEMNDYPVYANLKDAIGERLVNVKDIDDAVRHVLEAKIRLGLFEHPYVDEAIATAVVNDPAHRDLAEKVAERSAVLLRNEGAVLPLKADQLKSIAVIGPLADSRQNVLGSWVFAEDRGEAVTIFQGIKDRVGKDISVKTEEGVRIKRIVTKSPFEGLNPPEAEAAVDPEVALKNAVALAAESDVAVLVLGESQDMSGEAASRATLDLPGRQLELLKAVAATGKPIVVVLMSGRPLDLTEVNKVAPAVIDVWYPGTRGGTAVARLLFGDAVPGGKLPFTWPRNSSQIPLYYNHYTTQSPENASRRYWDEVSSPLYPFGYGLSYSTFSFTDIALSSSSPPVGSSITVTARLTNTGKVAADDVAQLYIHQRYGSAVRPIRELKGFQRVTLEPGASRLVTFELKKRDLCYWSTAKRDWILEPSIFDVWIGDDSTAKLHTQFQTTGAAQIGSTCHAK